jgi:hypothetical protein
LPLSDATDYGLTRRARPTIAVPVISNAPASATATANASGASVSPPEDPPPVAGATMPLGAVAVGAGATVGGTAVGVAAGAAV